MFCKLKVIYGIRSGTVITVVIAVHGSTPMPMFVARSSDISVRIKFGC